VGAAAVVAGAVAVAVAVVAAAAAAVAEVPARARCGTRGPRSGLARGLHRPIAQAR
jgi:Spy/CpxP family protein refolding chaperone